MALANESTICVSAKTSRSDGCNYITLLHNNMYFLCVICKSQGQIQVAEEVSMTLIVMLQIIMHVRAQCRHRF